MELVGAVILLAIIIGLSRRSKFWTPLRGAPTPKSADQANAVTDNRIRLLHSIGQACHAIAVRLGSIRFPLEVLSKPTIILGLPGTGKTSLINMMLPSLFSLFGIKVGRTRFVILDVKNESPGRLNALLPGHIPISFMNPLDTRATPLDYPKMFADRSDINQLAHTICPPTPGDQTPYFRDAARQCIALVVMVLQAHRPKASKPWGLFELICILSDKKLLRRVMNRNFEARSYYKATLSAKNKVAADVFGTIRSVIQPLVPAALAELDARDRFDMHAFLRSDGVAVLGVPPKGSQSVLPIYSVIIRRLIEEAQTISHPDDRLFLILDEVAMLDKSVVDAIIKATCVGRSHGIHVISATQSVELLESQFGEKEARAFLASCANTIGFRCSRKTADFVVGLCGNQEGIMLLSSVTSTKDGRSTTITEHFMTLPTVMAEQLTHAPLADPIRDSMTFVAVSPSFETAFVVCPFIEETTVAIDATFPNTSHRLTGAGGLRPLTPSDFEALGFPRR